MKKTSFKSCRSWVTPMIVGALFLHLGGCASEPLSDEGEPSSSSSALASRAAASRSVDDTTAAGSEKITAVVAARTKSSATTSGDAATVIPVSGGSGGTSDLESSHPWAVRISGTGGLDCRGVLIHPSWVLTAAHCIGTIAGNVSYARTDPTTGAVSQDSRSFDVYGRNQGMFVPNTYVAGVNFGQPKDDIALIRLATPFTIDRNIQTVGLPRSPANPGRTGIIATNDHSAALPAGYTAIVHSPQLAPADCAAPSGFLCINPPATSLCQGDSGSGFVMTLDGRATVVGIVSNGSNLDPTNHCIGVNGQAELTDVYSYRDWILGTMGMSLEQVAGRVRLRGAGASSFDMLRGIGASSTGMLSLRCLSTDSAAPPPYVEVATNVPGGEIAIDCDGAQVFCLPPAGLSLTGFDVRTIGAGGTTTALPYLSDFTVALVHPGASFQQYTCTVGGGLLTSTGTPAALMAL